MQNHGSPKEPLPNPKYKSSHEDGIRAMVGEHKILQNELMRVRKEIQKAPFRRMTVEAASGEVHNFYFDAGTDCAWE
jgi:hypothetical protein